MFQLVCINSMALCKRLVLVNVNGCYSFPLKHAVGGFGAFTSGPQRREIFFCSCFTPLLSSDSTQGRERSPEASLEALLSSQVSTMRGLKRYLKRRSTKQQRQVHSGDTFQPRGLTPAPLTRRTGSIFSPRRLGFFFFQVLKKSPRRRMK